MSAESHEPPVGKPLLTRRRVLETLLLVSSAYFGAKLLSRKRSEVTMPANTSGRDLHNFAVVFGSPSLRQEFKGFLKNVFHLYPEDAFDQLIAECVGRDPRDPAAYRQLETRLEEITPWLADLRYSLPALRRQKGEMASQSMQLLAGASRVEGYLEIGSHGRYLDALAERVTIEGPIYTCGQSGASRSPADVVDRGSLGLPGAIVPWRDYEPIAEREIPSGSLELVTVFIGLHHARPEQRVPYAASLARVLKKSGRLIVRDHDVTTEPLRHIVSLAHDVFNVGTKQSWAANEQERRNFYSLEVLCSFMKEAGLVAEPPRLLQSGDPTKNTLLVFRKA